MEEKDWYVYLLKCLDNSYYIGITNNLEKIMAVHKSGKGSKYVSAKGFGHLISSKKYPNKSEALRAEYKAKQLPKSKKLMFFDSD
jgi:putative endonuclease